jgi:ADP-ribosyl-[dinitrogen reductase] hydrolase
MDALAMALHIVWHKNNFRECVIWAANMGGDCDTVGAICCQIAGSIYGFDGKMFDLYSQMKDFT